MKNGHTENQKKRLRSVGGLVVLLGVGVIGSLLWAREYRAPVTKMPHTSEADLPGRPANGTTQTSGAARKVKLSVEDGRPLAQAILVLQERFGFVITYEDPRYVNADEMSDVTEQVRRDLDKFPPGQAPRVLVPKGGTLVFEYDSGSDSSPPDANLIMQQLLAAHAVSGHAGTFGIETGTDVIHVFPTAGRDVSGRITAQKSVLDEVINLPAQERTGLQTLEALCAAVSKATGQRVVVGTIPDRLFDQYKDRKERKLKARDALVQLLEEARNGARLSWRLLYDPGLKIYALNIRPIHANIASD